MSQEETRKKWQRNGVLAGTTGGEDTGSGWGQMGGKEASKEEAGQWSRPGLTGQVKGSGMEGGGQGAVTLRRYPRLPWCPGNGDA